MRSVELKRARVDWAALLSPLLVGFLICITAWAAITLTESTGRVASIWLANGILLAILLRSPSKAWAPYCFAAFCGNVLANYWTGNTIPISLGLSACNSFEVLVAAYPLRFILGPRFSLTRGDCFASFITFAVILAPAATALLASSFLAMAVEGSFLDILVIWYPADALGMAIMVPALLSVSRHDLKQLIVNDQWLRSGGVAVLLLAVTMMVFSSQEPRLAFLIYLPLVIAVLQMGFTGGALAILMTGALALTFSIQGIGPFTLDGSAPALQQLQLLQAFVACAFLIALPLAVIKEHDKRLTLDLERANRKLAEIATTDALTGLPNRRLFDRTMLLEWRRAQRTGEPLSVIALDVDNFKGFNDLYGHPEGDKCLRSIAEICNLRLRRAGDLLARLGGEEFVAVLPNTPAEGAETVAERMRLAVELAQIDHRLSDSNCVTISLGVATITSKEAETAEALLSQADQALYKAKASGRNRVEVFGRGAPSGEDAAALGGDQSAAE